MAYTLQEVLKDEESALRLYFDDIADSTPLSREKEVELSAKIHAGDRRHATNWCRPICASSST